MSFCGPCAQSPAAVSHPHVRAPAVPWPQDPTLQCSIMAWPPWLSAVVGSLTCPKTAGRWDGRGEGERGQAPPDWADRWTREDSSGDPE